MFSTQREDHPIKTLQNDGCFPVTRDSTLLTVLVCTVFAYAILTLDLFCPLFVQEPLHLRIKVHEYKNEITCTAMRIGSAIFFDMATYSNLHMDKHVSKHYRNERVFPHVKNVFS